MLTFKQFIAELFTDSHGGKATATDDHFAVVKKIGDRHIAFSATDDGGGDWEISFEDENGIVDMTGKGNAVQIISFVIASTRDFIKRYDPPYIVFKAAASEESRVSLYKQLVKRFGKDYKTEESRHGDVQIFLMRKVAKQERTQR